MHNSDQNNFDSLSDHIYTKIVIIFTIGLNLLKHQDKMTLIV